MSVLDVVNLSYGYTDVILLNNVSVRINDGEHVGLVGLNGCGKSTFMNLIAHRLIPDSGEIIWDKSKSFSYLDQMLEVNDDKTISEYLYDVYADLFKKEEDMNKLYESLAYETDYDKILNKAEKINEYLEEKGFYKIKSNIGNIINGLGIDIEENRCLKNLSGGQRAKVFLGKMLLEEKDVLLLDEPTNFLDASHIEWLSKFLNGYKKEFLVISHDISFLNAVCNVIIDLDNKKLTRYKGNYDAFISQKEVNRESYIKQYEKQQRVIKQMETFIAKNIVRSSTTKQAQSRRKVLEKMEKLEKVTVEKDVHFNFPFTHSFNMAALEVKNLSIGYDKVILSNINLKLEFGGKYVIVGANGVGKTTFVKTVLGIIPALGGSVKLTKYNDVTYYAQEEDVCDITPIDYFREKYPKMDNTSIRTLLGNYGIRGEKPLSSMTELSGGELSKVRLARLSLESSNFLVLDEPTNHLDKNAKKALYKCVTEYPGTVVMVSHDKEFYKELGMKEIKF